MPTCTLDQALASGSNIFIRAVAGAGKTSLLKKIARQLNNASGVYFVAYNRAIVQSMKKHTIPAKVTTLHALGYHILQSENYNLYCDPKKLQTTFLLLSQKLNKSLSLEEILSFTKAYMYLENMDGLTWDPPQWTSTLPKDFPTQHTETFFQWIPLVKEIKYRLFTEHSHIDYDDMITIPCKNDHLAMPVMSTILVDEAQDLNPIQCGLLKKLNRGSLRYIFVGDPMQSIYGFRGSDTQMVDTIIQDFQCQVLNYNQTWRTPKVLEPVIQQMVPSFHTHAEALQGQVYFIEENDMPPLLDKDSMVLGRTNREVVKAFFSLYEYGIPTQINASSFFEELTTQLDELTRKEGIHSVSELVHTLKKQGKNCIQEALYGIFLTRFLKEHINNSISAVLSHLRALANIKAGPLLSTVHRAKGLEAKKVFIIKPNSFPSHRATTGKELLEEKNLVYVALTRTKEQLFIVEENHQAVSPLTTFIKHTLGGCPIRLDNAFYYYMRTKRGDV